MYRNYIVTNNKYFVEWFWIWLLCMVFLKSAQKVKSIVVANSDFPQRSYLTL